MKKNFGRLLVTLVLVALMLGGVSAVMAAADPGPEVQIQVPLGTEILNFEGEVVTTTSEVTQTVDLFSAGRCRLAGSNLFAETDGGNWIFCSQPKGVWERRDVMSSGIHQVRILETEEFSLTPETNLNFSVLFDFIPFDVTIIGEQLSIEDPGDFSMNGGVFTQTVVSGVNLITEGGDIIITSPVTQTVQMTTRFYHLRVVETAPATGAGGLAVAVAVMAVGLTGFIVLRRRKAALKEVTI